ncbi:GNAT family N-acetyltransferase [Segatella paludivivens]|uniref:GNAT family N-acetyltransferase n=1 Tax=Segatella paludivivens TaxID=185294 RepID=UPI00036463D1|nr:GNAT family N-acetyltransferase [Segatella paludivivens]
MEIIKAGINDLIQISKMYRDAIDNLNRIGIYQWDEIYPNELTLKEDIEKRELHKIISEDHLLGAVVINQETDEEYANGHFEDDNYAVVHRLCVAHEYQNQKIGYHAMMLIESLLKEQGFCSIRLDAFSENPFSLKMYEKLGYRKVGNAQWRKGLFYLFEKKL